MRCTTDYQATASNDKPDGNENDGDSGYTRYMRVATRERAEGSKYGMSGRGEKR